MADILPIEPLLPTIDEGENFIFTFEPSLEVDEILTSIEITQTDMPSAIIVDGATFKGNFAGLFALPPNSLKYRYNDELFETDSFDKLPPKGTADLYSYSAPRQMIKNFSIVVNLKYMKGEVGAELPMEMNKTFTQPVQGNWSTFTQSFLNYLR